MRDCDFNLQRLAACIAAAVLVTSLAGCQTGAGPFDDWVHAPPPAWRTQANTALEHGAAALQDEHLTTTPLAIPQDAGADDYARMALGRNPSIRAAQQKVARFGQRIDQATSLDDPTYNVAAIGAMAETAAGQAGLMTGVSQKFPWPGKLTTRGRIAAQDVAAAVAELDQVKLEVVADTRRAYWSYYYAARAIEVTRDSRTLVEQFRETAEAKLKAGMAKQQDVLRATVEISNIDRQLVTLEQQRASAAAMLNSLMDRASTAELPPPRPVEPTTLAMRLDRLLADASLQNPQLQGVRQRIEASRQRLKLARLDRWPDPTVSANYVAVDDDGLSPVANGKDQWWLGLSFNLPIWQQKRDAAEQEALHGMYEGLAELQNMHNRVAFRVRDAFLQAEAQQRLVLLLRDQLLPQAHRTVEATLNGYRANTASLLDLIDAWRTELTYVLAYQQSLAQLEQSFADLQRAVGHDLNRNDTPAPLPEEDGKRTPAPLPP